MSLSHQDWTPVVIRKNTNTNQKKANSSNLVPKQGVNKQNTSIKTEKVWNGVNPNDEPETRPVKIDKEFGQQILKARLEKKMTQKNLANAISIPDTVIAEYERGIGLHNGNYISKIKKYLNINKNTV